MLQETATESHSSESPSGTAGSGPSLSPESLTGAVETLVKLGSHYLELEGKRQEFQRELTFKELQEDRYRFEMFYILFWPVFIGFMLLIAGIIFLKDDLGN